MSKPKMDIKEAFAEYARKELEFVENSDPEKLYHRVLPNLKDKTKGSIDFLFKKISVGGNIDKDTIYLTKYRISKWGKEADLPLVFKKIEEAVASGDMKLVNNIVL